jgi:hypothetical protein
MRTVHYQLIDVEESRQSLQMPASAKVLNVVVVGPQTRLYYLTNTGHPNVERKFRVVGTDHVIDPAEELTYVGTTVSQDGGSPLVWQIFEVAPPEDAK